MAPITAEELLRIPSEADLLELIDGEIRTLPFNGGRHGLIAARAGLSLGAYVKQHGLGVAVAAGTGFLIRRNPDTVRTADVAFVRTDRWNNPEGFFEGAPDLVIEVISPNETYTAVTGKIRDWLKSGAELVIVNDPGRQSAEIHRSLTESVRIDINGSLDGGTVVPGWTLPLRDLFVP
jgi:Uma2 family endonuclease